MSSFCVEKGPVALRVGKYWVGYASGDIPCDKYRIMADRALEDAEKLEQYLKRELPLYELLPEYGTG